MQAPMLTWMYQPFFKCSSAKRTKVPLPLEKKITCQKKKRMNVLLASNLLLNLTKSMSNNAS